MFQATVTLGASADPIHVEGEDRDRVIDQALGYAPEASRDDLRSQLGFASRWLWLLPSRTATEPGVQITVTRVSD